MINYRDAYNMFACNGILFNHESPRRGETFVTRKVTREVSKIQLGLSDVLVLGNLNSKRDWGHARDYVEVIWSVTLYRSLVGILISAKQNNFKRILTRK